MSFTAARSEAVPVSHALPRSERLCLALAFVVPLVWFFVFNGFYPEYLVDEGGHMGNIYHFLEHKAGWPEQMTMLPGYHFIVAALWQLGPPFSLLTLARLVSTASALIGIAAFAAAWRRVHSSDVHYEHLAGVGRMTLLFALLPLLQPFTGLAYTDMLALAAVFVAVVAHFAGQRTLAALLFVGAACVRQTNLLWAAYLVAWEFLRTDEPRRQFFRRAGGLMAVLAVAAGVVLATGRVTVGTQTGTAAQLNIATLHFAAMLVLVLGLPAWIAALPDAFRQGAEFARRYPGRAISAVLLIALAVLALSRTFANPHGWNRALFWDGCTFTLLRNWPLVWIDTHPWLRVLSSLNVVLMTLAVVLVLARQPHRRELRLAIGAGLAMPFANNLVEPRYFIAGVAFVWLFLRIEVATARWLTWWSAAICIAHAPFIARGLSLW